jgi:non-specific serine/threonine protein kinase
MLDFSVDVVLDGEKLSNEELQQILASDEGMILMRGKWIEVDKDKLGQMLTHWKSIQKTASSHQLSFTQAMRLLSGAAIGDTTEIDDGIQHEWSRVVAGKGLMKVLESLQNVRAGMNTVAGLNASLRPYQKIGVQWLFTLHQLGLGACLADDMGLGKTIQIIALLLLLKKGEAKRPNLLVIPASLIANWQSEINQFAPSLKVEIVHPSFSLNRSGQYADLVITTYGMLNRTAWITDADWGLVVLDEAQAIKNPGAQQTRAVKKLKSKNRIVLTGTPIENRLSDLWSLFDFICPGLLGSAKGFQTYTKKIAKTEEGSYGPLRTLVRPYILRRLKTDRKIISDLPDKTEMKGYCFLTKRQAVLYQQSVIDLQEQLKVLAGVQDGIRRKGIVLSFLLRFKQICNHPSLWLNDGGFGDSESGKYGRLRELCESISAKQEKVLVFTQFQKMTRPLHQFLSGLFGREGLILDGGTPVKKRKEFVAQFQDEGGPPFFILSLKAGGVGLNLTAASHVIHFDRWWNPAVENQATDRAYRIGQKKNILVHKFICRGTIEEKVDEMIESKKGLSQEILSGGHEALLTEMKNEELIKMVSLDIHSALADG